MNLKIEKISRFFFKNYLNCLIPKIAEMVKTVGTAETTEMVEIAQPE